jgi:hypothetical protein
MDKELERNLSTFQHYLPLAEFDNFEKNKPKYNSGKNQQSLIQKKVIPMYFSSLSQNTCGLTQPSLQVSQNFHGTKTTHLTLFECPPKSLSKE